MKQNKRLGRRLSGILPAAVFLLGGCVSLTEKTGRILDGTVFAEKTEALYREEGDRGVRVGRKRRRDGTEFIEILSGAMPNLRLYGDAPGAEGGFTLRQMDFFVSNLSGWNEFSRGILGSGTLRIAGEGAVLRLEGKPEVLDISAGKIRRQEARLTGAEALTALRNREERVRSLTEWMRQREPGREFPDQKAFEAWWKPVLFPELVRAKKRPPEWTALVPGGSAKEEGSARVRGEDVRWNIRYTEAVFPEELRPVRNSGTLLRDWEEAAGWIYFQFEWDRIMEALAFEIRLTKVK
ncbi:MAG: hypothetical protein LBU21_02745 [Treponema sp.]|jgi:hypothetical protein|nr:hypothetical protein [Treponema sp.]